MKPKPRIYTVATSHLDTSWNWTLETTIGEYLPKVATQNFPLLEKYPEYRFSFEGAYRYELFEEYYPELFSKISEYVAAGRWFVAGSAYENGDVNIPSPEALIRNLLYGNTYFEEKFGKRSRDVFLPDCFGFGFALPSVAHHMNLLGFTTQKLTWSGWAGVPFDLGKWYGADGRYIFAELDARGYQKVFKKGVRSNYMARHKLASNMHFFNLPFTVILHGVGDRGGAPAEESVATVVREIRKNRDGIPLVLSAPSDAVFRDMDALLSEEEKGRLPEWRDELVSTNHGAGGYTSRTASKRLNRRAELLNEAAERFSLGAELITGRQYNKAVIDTCYKRVISHQFHDDITGTSLMDCYKRNWNDYFISLAQACAEYASAVGSIASTLNTSGFTMPVAVSNPLQYSRTDSVYIPTDIPEQTQVFLGKSELPVTAAEAGVFVSVPLKPLSVTVLDVRHGKTAHNNTVRVLANGLESDTMLVKIDENGDVCSIYDKTIARELLCAPISFDLLDYEGCYSYAAWEINYPEVSAAPVRKTELVSIEALCEGDAAAQLKITKRDGESVFIQTVTLTRGSRRVEIYNEVDWRSLKTLCKARFPLASRNKEALYDLGLGYIRRPVNTERRFEVPAQMWAAIPDESGEFTCAVLSDSRIGWDMPDEGTLRLTCMHTPRHRYRESSAQHLLDFGINRFGFAVCGCAGDDMTSIQREALCFSSQPAVFSTDIHRGKGESVSFASLNTDNVLLRALKKSQKGDEIIARVNQANGKEAESCKLSLFTPLSDAREVYGSEEELAPACTDNGSLVFNMKPFEIKSFALTLVKAKNKPSHFTAVELGTGFAFTSPNNSRTGCDELNGFSFPKELTPQHLTFADVPFTLGSEAIVCNGRHLTLPSESKYVYILACATGGDKRVAFTSGSEKTELKIADLLERIGAWDLYALGETGYVKSDTPAFVSTHLHNNQGDAIGQNGYMFMYRIPVCTQELVLPNNKGVIIFAATAAKQAVSEPLCPLYDTLAPRECDFTLTKEQDEALKIGKLMSKQARYRFIKGYAARQLEREKKMGLHFYYGGNRHNDN